MIKSISIVGAGNISSYHIEAFLKADIEIKGICAKNQSRRAFEKATTYQLPYFNNIVDLITYSNAESYLVCVEATAITGVIEYFKETNSPLLIEKPGPLYENFDNSNWYVAYNRRFYEPIVSLRDSYLDKSGYLDFEFIESGSFEDVISIFNTLFTNTAHGVDLIRYIVGDFTLIDLEISKQSSLIQAKILDKNDKFVGRLTIIFGAPSNTSIRLVNAGEIYYVKPLENLTKFNSLEVVEPSEGNKIRSYKPIWIGESDQILECDLEFKPGFLGQALAFKYSLNSPNSRLCTIQENFKNLKILEQIISFLRANL